MANFGYLQVTRGCNQNCVFCSNPKTEANLSSPEGKKIIDKLIADGCDGVIFTGGEPTIYGNLLELVDYCNTKNLSIKLITNGQRLADKKFLQTLISAGVKHFHISFYSYKKEVQNYLTNKKDAWENLRLALTNLSEETGVVVNINTVINKYNSDHLSQNISWINQNFPKITHFVWNNLDPQNPGTKNNLDVIPRLNDFYLELKKATELLKKGGRTFRVERVPLCYMPGFEHCSTETRKIVKNENRNTYFLDNEKKYFKEAVWEYGKASVCSICSLNKICAGLYMLDKYYYSKELFPVFKDMNEVIYRVKNSN